MSIFVFRSPLPLHLILLLSGDLHECPNRYASPRIFASVRIGMPDRYLQHCLPWRARPRIFTSVQAGMPGHVSENRVVARRDSIVLTLRVDDVSGSEF